MKCLQLAPGSNGSEMRAADCRAWSRFLGCPLAESDEQMRRSAEIETRLSRMSNLSSKRPELWTKSSRDPLDVKHSDGRELEADRA